MVLFPRYNIKTGTGKKVKSRGYFVNRKKSYVKRIFRKKEKKNRIQLTYATNIDGILWFIHVRVLA